MTAAPRKVVSRLGLRTNEDRRPGGSRVLVHQIAGTGWRATGSAGCNDALVRVVRWGMVCISVVALLSAVLATAFVVTGRDCPLGWKFERSSGEVVEYRVVPPRIVCRYEFVRGADGIAIYPPETETFDATVQWVVALALTAISGVVFVLSRRHRDRQPTSMADEAIPTS